MRRGGPQTQVPAKQTGPFRKPQEKACVESRSGAVRRRRAIAGAAPFGMTVPEYLSLSAVSTPRSSNRTGGFPAFGFRTRLAQDYAHGKLLIQLSRERRSNLPSLSPATSSGASERAREVIGVPPPSVLAPSDVSLELRPLPSLGLSPSSQVSGRRRRPLKRLPPSAAQTGRAVFPHPAFMKGLSRSGERV